MRSSFPLFQSHLDMAHAYWERLLKKNDIAIDATCGNGQDTLILSRLAGRVYAIDIQPRAIQKTKLYLSEHASDVNVTLIEGCHSTFPKELTPASAALIIYNLGYLPGGDKKLTTQRETTLLSLKQALVLIKPGGLITLTCYPGHEEGAHEQSFLLPFAANLPPTEWSCCHHQWLNRRKSPSLLVIQRGESQEPLRNKGEGD